MTSVRALLARSALPRVEARLLLASVLGVPAETLIAWPERAVDDESAARFANLSARRAQGEPVAYLLGEHEFWGLPFYIDESVSCRARIPRR